MLNITIRITCRKNPKKKIDCQTQEPQKGERRKDEAFEINADESFLQEESWYHCIQYSASGRSVGITHGTTSLLNWLRITPPHIEVQCCKQSLSFSWLLLVARRVTLMVTFGSFLQNFGRWWDLWMVDLFCCNTNTGWVFKLAAPTCGVDRKTLGVSTHTIFCALVHLLMP